MTLARSKGQTNSFSLLLLEAEAATLRQHVRATMRQHVRATITLERAERGICDWLYIKQCKEPFLFVFFQLVLCQLYLKLITSL